MAIKGRDKIKEYMKKYAGGGVDFFSLKNDQEEAVIRFLHGDDQDLPLYLVHKVEMDDRDRWVECIENDCPFCETYGKPMLKLFLFLYDYSDDKVKCWERGVAMVDTLLGYIDKCGPLNNRDYTILRHGKKGDSKTTYQLFSGDKGPMIDSKTKKEIQLPEKPSVYGRFVLQMTKKEMEEHVAENEPIKKDEKVKARDKKTPF